MAKYSQRYWVCLEYIDSLFKKTSLLDSYLNWIIA